MKLTIAEINTGHYQITYKTQNESGETIYYCLQESSRDHVEFLRCTQEWEPSHPAKPKSDSLIKIELAPGNSPLEIACNKFIKNHPNFEGF